MSLLLLLSNGFQFHYSNFSYLAEITPEMIQKAVRSALHQQVVELKRAQRAGLEDVEKKLIEKLTNTESTEGAEGEQKPAKEAETTKPTKGRKKK